MSSVKLMIEKLVGGYSQLFIESRLKSHYHVRGHVRGITGDDLCNECREIIQRKSPGWARCPHCSRWLRISSKGLVSTTDYAWFSPPIYTTDDGREFIPQVNMHTIARHLAPDDPRPIILALRPYLLTNWIGFDFDLKSLMIDADAKEYHRRSASTEPESANPSLWMDPGELERITTALNHEVRQFLSHLSKVTSTYLVLRSSVGGGIHVHCWVSGIYHRDAITGTVRAWLDRTHQAYQSLDPRIHPCNSSMRIPLGYGSRLLNPSTLMPMFPFPPVEARKRELRYLDRHADQLLVTDTMPLDAFGDVTPHRAFTTSEGLRTWSDGISKPGERRNLTATIALLGLSLGAFGEELHQFVTSWVQNHHHNRSRDINSALADGSLDPIISETREIVESVVSRYRTRPPISLLGRLDISRKRQSTLDAVVMPASIYSEIGRRLALIIPPKSERYWRMYRAIVACHGYAFSMIERGQMSPRFDGPDGSGPYSSRVWRRLCGHHYLDTKQVMVDAGLLAQGNDGVWYLPLMTTPYADLCPFWKGVSAIIDLHPTAYVSRMIRRHTIAESRNPWGTGRWTYARAYTLLRQARKSVLLEEETLRPPKVAARRKFA